MTTGAAATSRFVKEFTAAATLNNTTPTKNTRRRSRSRSRRTLGDLRKAVTTLEEIERIARRVFGGAHPTTTGIGGKLRKSQVALHARETQGEAQDAFRTARAKLAQERSELAQALADASAGPSQDASRGA